MARKSPTVQTKERAQLRFYADVIALWSAKFDSAEIAQQTGLPEATVARWIANCRDVMFESAPMAMPLAA